jgi:FkbM family methyltransferase
MPIMSELMSVLKTGRKVPQPENAFNAQRFLFDNNSDMVIFDIGAYIGEVTKIYGKLFPSAKIYCFEPFDGSFQKLASLSDNKLVHPYQMAFSDQLGKTKLYVNEDLTCNSFFPRPKSGPTYYSRKAEHVGQIEVDSMTIDAFCEQKDIEHIDVLKLDVEGAELRVLKGACDKLSKRAITLIYTEVMFAVHYEGGCMFHEIAGFLEQYGYTLFNLYNLKRAKNGQIRWGNAIFLSPQFRDRVNEMRCV